MNILLILAGLVLFTIIVPEIHILTSKSLGFIMITIPKRKNYELTSKNIISLKGGNIIFRANIHWLIISKWSYHKVTWKYINGKLRPLYAEDGIILRFSKGHRELNKIQKEGLKIFKDNESKTVGKNKKKKNSKSV